MTSNNDPALDQDPVAEDDIDHSAPLLGPPGSASQGPTQPLRMNVILGAAPVAQIGVWGIVLTIWINVIFRANWILFSYHPILNSTALLLVSQSVLLLQPTHTAEQKRLGAVTHGLINGTALLLFTTAVAIIIYNKEAHHGAHFASAHGRIGLITYILLVLQTGVGIAMFYTPQVFGSVARGKAIWKYHRASGYIVWTLILINSVLGTQSDWFLGVWNNTWVWVVLAVIAFLGMISRIRLSKIKLL